MAEHHRLSCAPVLVIDLRAVLRGNRAHGLPPFSSAEVVDLSCPSNGLRFSGSESLLCYFEYGCVSFRINVLMS